ncbi:3-methyladenine DNA glycosylase [Cellulosimicrobium protaetiae]|uniref:3-methyladenine DNA glycosylase n=1 Tax=Cellulosimicrobium protaetiae TaxID=2587808 RepID=A0A6M5UM75_9MICO|nr:3-methyladenine DNA glycosylase [Cellulosimicrobium protaetiae]QJW38351.1 3-methyladenine DNA glycosylase [Cellulosimicrobium protaetiae]
MLAVEEWIARELAHAERADAFTAGWRERKPRGEQHAIEDFLFTYYPTRPAQLRRWHPGPGVVLARPPCPASTRTPRPDDEPADPYTARTGWRWYREAPEGLVLDADAFLADRGDTVRYLRTLLAATASRPGRFGCFGLHEWAMVYRDREAGRDHRHPLPLRLGHEGTDHVVESHPVQCSHFDAFRFFTPEAGPLNRLRPTRETQPAMEQPGCLHATMDLYKWALKLSPAVPGELVLDCFELARDVRVVDMRASPYDVSAYGLEPVAIETPEGKAEYVRHQREFAERGAALRARLVEVCDALLGSAPDAPEVSATASR